MIKDEIQLQRAKHAVYENQRTIDAVTALKAGDIERFGKLMNQSHISLRDDYDVSCEEMISVDLAWRFLVFWFPVSQDGGIWRLSQSAS